MAFRLSPILVPIRGVDEFSKVMNTTGKRIQRMGSGMRRAGRAMTMGLTLPAVVLGTSMLKTAGDFQLSMNRVQGITSATQAEFAGLTKEARRLGATTQFTASDAADAMGNLALAGFKTDEIMKSISGTMTLAAAGQMDLAEASNISASILRGFSLDAAEAGRVNDVLVNTFTNTNTTLGELGEGMRFVATIASSMQIPLEEVSAAMGLLGNVGLKGAMAGTALRGALAKITNPAREAVEVLNRLGIRKEDVLDSKGNVRGLIEVVEALETAGASAGDLLQIFGQRAGPGMAGLVKQGSDALRKMTEQVKTQGTAQKVADIQMKGFIGSLRRMRSAFAELGIAIGETGLLDFLTEMVTKMAGLFKRISEVNPTLLRWGAIAIGVAAAIGPLLVVLGSIAGAIGGLIVLFSAPALVGLVAALTPVWGTLLLIVAAMTAWGVAILQVIAYWDNIKDTFTDLKLLGKTLSIMFGGSAGEFSEGPPAGAAALGAEAAMAGMVAAAGVTPEPAKVEITHTNVPPGTRTEVVSGGDNVKLDTEMGLLTAGTP